jgi:hypothetical protein
MRTTVFTRRRHSRATSALTAVAVLIVLALAVAVVEHLAEVLILLTVVGAVALFRRNRRASSRATVEAPPRRPAVPPAPHAPPAAGIPRLLDGRAMRNGWMPPRAPRVMSGVSAACAEGDCISCPGAPCACLCRHESARIVAINGGLADLAGGGDGQTSIPGVLR